MNNLSKIAALVVAFCIISTPLFACHSTYFNEVFTKAIKANLNKDQLFALKSLKSRMMASDHQKGRCQHDRIQNRNEFVAAAAGVLNDKQFQTITGKQKTEVQKLRYEVTQLKKELAEIKALLRELKK